MFKNLSRIMIMLLSVSLIISTVLSAKVFASEESSMITDNEISVTDNENNITEDDPLSPDEYLTDEEIEKLGGAESVEPDQSHFRPSDEVTRDDFETEEEYQKYQSENTYITPRLVWLIPPAIALVTRVGGKLVVKQSLKNTTKNLTIRNGALAGKKHPVTNILFDKNGFPIFPNKAQYTLPMDLLKSSNSTQFKFANQQLLIKVTTNLSYRSQFTSAQIAQIKKLQTPSGYIWNHHQNRGVLQLVDAVKHSKTGHTGGKAIWGSL
ncbi:HNH endonuclease [Viridibacillus sp. YIM B01967]|uniref:HNH endonuclease n=1 Tax=Viridibacillus soli TaxID=2798301 RepID=A0ABS1H6B1_9BACL|nr:HNH endonuclease [Viridibacillus soli]MBK3494941.1 HNH endonuclease [Viridibacillus soli]